MADSYDKIIKDFEKYMGSWVGHIHYPSWYVGIAADARKRLSKEHFVKDSYIYSTASSKAVAAKVEQYFLDKGCDGSSGGGSPDSKQVYVYLKKSGTKQ